MSYKPLADEYAPFYATYIALTSDQAITEILTQNWATVRATALEIPQEKTLFRYAPEKWSVQDLWQHIIDTERIMAYRALRIARGDSQIALHGFEQDDYVLSAKANERNWFDLLEDFDAVRQATITLFKSFSPAMLIQKGIASEKTVSVRALGFIIVGHAQHHLNILQERYLPIISL